MEEKKENKRRVWLGVAIAVGLVCIVWISIGIGRVIENYRTRVIIEHLSNQIGTYEDGMAEFATEAKALNDIMSGNDKLLQTILTIRNNYVDPIPLDTLYEKAIPALLSELDPHSEYIPAKMFDRVNESLEGEFDGIGIVFNALTDTITVLNVIPQGPSDKAGVRPGDRVILIDGQEVAGKGLAQDSMVRLMRGPRGSKVKLSVKRGTLDKYVDFTITRAPIELHSVETAFILDKEAGIGFVRLSQFSRTSYAEVREALDSLSEQGMKRVLFWIFEVMAEGSSTR